MISMVPKKMAVAGVLLALASGGTAFPAAADPIFQLPGGFASIGDFLDFTLPDRQVPLASVTELLVQDPLFGSLGTYGLGIDNSASNGSWAAYAFGVTNPQFLATATTQPGWNSTTLNLADPTAGGSGFVNDAGNQVFFLEQNGIRLNYDNLVQVVDNNGFMNFYWTNDAGFVLGLPGVNVFSDDFTFFPPFLASDYVVFLVDTDPSLATPTLAAVSGAALASVPEPASGLLLLGGLVGLGVVTRRRRRLALA